MRGWALSDEGGGLSRWTSVISVAHYEARVRLVTSRLVLIFVFLLDFHGRVREVKSMFISCALHGAEASLCLRAVFGSCVLLFFVGGSLWQVLVLSWACWMVLRGVIRLFVWSGSVSVCSGGIWRFGQPRSVGFTAIWRWCRAVLGMVLFIHWLPVLFVLDLNGIPLCLVGAGIAWAE